MLIALLLLLAVVAHGLLLAGGAQLGTLLAVAFLHAGAASAVDYTANLIATMRVSEEGQDGLRAALEKRRPSFAEESCSDGS